MCSALDLTLEFSLKTRQVGYVRRHEAIQRLTRSLFQTQSLALPIFGLIVAAIMEASF